MTFTITGEYSGMVYGVRERLPEAVRYAHMNGFTSSEQGVWDALKALGPGEAWKSEKGPRGIKIARMS